MLICSWLSLCYTIFCSLVPIVVMSLMGEVQLKNEQFTCLLSLIYSVEKIIANV